MRTHSVYKVRNGSGDVVFRGSAQEIAEHFFISITHVYEVTKGKADSFLGEYTTEYECEEPYIPHKEVSNA